MTQVDPALSRYQEVENGHFTRIERRRLRVLLRRLQFLEHKTRETPTNGGAMHSEWEIEALEWALVETFGFVVVVKND